MSDSSKMKILHVGRLSYEKNVDVLIFSIKKIIKQYPNIVFDIIGEGPAEDYLKKIAKKLKLQNNINFLGYIPRENLPRIYNSHDIFITASTMETQGLVILEAMASGLPIVAVNKYAIPNLVHHNENGFLAKPGDSNEISKFVIQLIKNKKLRKEFGKNSFELSKKHDLVEVVKKMEEIYKKAIVKNSFIQSLKSSSCSQLQPQF
ncbi:MAG: glycosyltransferase [Nanoarchaeota archaeon]